VGPNVRTALWIVPLTMVGVAAIALLLPRTGSADAGRPPSSGATEAASQPAPGTEAAVPASVSRSELIRIAAEGPEEAGRAAMRALAANGADPGDLDLVLGALADAAPEARSGYAELIVASAQEPLAGRASAALLDLLGSPVRGTQKDALRALWGVEMGPELSARVVRLAQDPACRRDALFLAVCPMPRKTERAVDELVRATSDADPSVRQRAWWGLGFGVPATRKLDVADHTLEHWDSDAPRPAQFAWLIVLLDSAGARHLAACERIAADESIAEHVRGYARFCARRVRERLAE